MSDPDQQNPWQPPAQTRPAPAFQPIPYNAEDWQRKQNADSLNLLAIGYYVMGGLTALASSFGLFHFFLGLGALRNPGSFRISGEPGSTPESLGYLFMAVGGTIVLLGWLFGGLTLYAGRCLTRHERPTLIYVMAALHCLHIPLGTVMGVLTFVLLSRPGVKVLFHGGATLRPYSPPVDGSDTAPRSF